MEVGFGDCWLDVPAHELRRDGSLVPMEPQVFEVLAHLVRHRDRVVPKTELLDEIWGDRFVSESALSSRIKSARRAVGDTGRAQRVIKTIHGRGYRFVAPVHEGDGGGREPAGGPTRAAPRPVGGLEVATSALAALDAGRGCALQVTGDHPATLARLVDPAYEEAARRGFLLGRGGGAGAGLRPYGCVVDAVDELLQRAPDIEEALPPTCRQELATVLAGAEPSTRARLFLTVREALVAAAARGPTLLVLDELHYADPDTLALLAHAARLTDHHPIVLVASHRPGLVLEGPYERVEVPSVDGAAGDSRTRIPPDLADVVRALALDGSTFDHTALRAAAAVAGRPADHERFLDLAVDAGLVEPLPAARGFRFAAPGLADDVAADLPPHRRTALHLAVAAELERLDVPPDRIAHHLVAGHEPGRALPYALEAARRADATQRYPEVLRWAAAVLDHADGDERRELLALRAHALAGTGDPTAVQAFREAIVAADGDATDLRAGLARTAVLTGDLQTAEETLSAVPVEASDSGPVLMVRAMLAYFRGDLDTADELVERARAQSLAAGATFRALDAITLQGLIAHNRGQWFDRLRRELRTTRDSPDLAVSVFDSHLCIAEYLLYGPTPYDEVVRLAGELEANGHRSGARRAVAFAVCLAGEAKLLAGDLDGAREDLERSVALHRELGADAGTAHSLQRLAEVDLAAGDPAAASRRLRDALAIARWSPLAHHLVQRTYGTLIAAAPDLDAALAVVREATDVVGDPLACEVCQVMIEVPATIACAEAGLLDEARAHLARAEQAAAYWEGAAWPAAVHEARATIARAQGDLDEAERLLSRAVELFDEARQPLDAGRCREALSG